MDSSPEKAKATAEVVVQIANHISKNVHAKELVELAFVGALQAHFNRSNDNLPVRLNYSTVAHHHKNGLSPSTTKADT